MHKLLYPKSIPNFLSIEDIQTIKTSVFALSAYWRKISDETKGNTPFDSGSYVLGRAAYCIKYSSEKINTDNYIMKANFSKLYENTEEFLKKNLGITKQISVLEDFTVPGFHIFSGPISKKNRQFHVDSSILNFYNNIPISSIYSFSSIIEGPTNCCYLEYEYNDKCSRFDYPAGHLNLWSAVVPHRIGSSSLSIGQYRITYQGHIFKYKNSYYMYF
jgi:hypothetical protein